jgi:hypothetical protein
MKKYLLIIIFSILIVDSAISQEDTARNWKTSGLFSLNASQVSFTNWAAGGENSVSGNSFVNLAANYKKDQMVWDNTLDLGFGLMKQGKRNLFKSDDKIDFSSKLGRHAFDHLFYTALINFKSQFAEGYKTMDDTVRISNFLAPGYLNVSIGMDYKPKDKFTLYLSPFSGKTTFVKDTLLSSLGAFGVTPGQNIRYEFGGYAKAQLILNLMKNVTYTTKLDLFSNYLKNPQNVDVNWENLITMKINGFFSANAMFVMLYDDDVKVNIDSNNDGVYDMQGSRLQMKQLFGIGLTYKF